MHAEYVSKNVRNISVERTLGSIVDTGSFCSISRNRTLSNVDLFACFAELNVSCWVSNVIKRSANDNDLSMKPTCIVILVSI